MLHLFCEKEGAQEGAQEKMSARTAYTKEFKKEKESENFFTAPTSTDMASSTSTLTNMSSPHREDILLPSDLDYYDLREEIKEMKDDIRSFCRQIRHNEANLQKTIKILENMTLEEKLIELWTKKVISEEKCYRNKIFRDKQFVERQEKRLKDFEEEFKKQDKEKKKEFKKFIDHINKHCEWI